MPSEPLRSLSSPCSLNALRLGEVFLLEFELRREIEQAHLASFLRRSLRQETSGDRGRNRIVLGIVDRRVFADVVLEEDRRHGRDVFVAEAQVGCARSRCRPA